MTLNIDKQCRTRVSITTPSQWEHEDETELASITIAEDGEIIGFPNISGSDIKDPENFDDLIEWAKQAREIIRARKVQT